MNTLLLSLYWSLSTAAETVAAQVFNGPGLEGGVDTAAAIEGPAHTTLREVILTIFYKVLNFLALGATIMIVLAGLYLLFSNGEDAQKDKAKKVIQYVILGLLVVLFARSIVGFMLYGLFA